MNFVYWALILVAIFATIGLVFMNFGTTPKFEETKQEEKNETENLLEQETLLNCTSSVLEIKKVSYPSTQTVGKVDVTIVYSIGEEKLDNLAAEVRKGGSTVVSSVISEIEPGELRLLSLFNTNLPPESVTVIATCRSIVNITDECKPNESCWEPY